MRNRKTISPKQEKGIAMFEARMYKRIPSRSSKYVVMEQPGTGHKIYLGRKGAIRAGRTISDSISIGKVR